VHVFQQIFRTRNAEDAREFAQFIVGGLTHTALEGGYIRLCPISIDRSRPVRALYRACCFRARSLSAYLVAQEHSGGDDVRVRPNVTTLPVVFTEPASFARGLNSRGASTHFAQ
jgi:hypothetical protein